ncbi:Rne/Rng family ribonuclease [Nioella nitratireducens]|uniref:Rne/Rng family ribonuclease n=1 Tax=Nioella nitratireducens TaxID=1287720 RepID=UPI0008FD0834|nr:ribonuclease E/G [Nioella nitratireducens]
MAKKMLIDATHAEETRVVVADGNKVEEFDFESLNKRQLAGNIYLAKVTRVEPSLQAAFVDYGGNRHGFLAFSEIHPDYYQIPTADREALLAEEQEYAQAQAEAETEAETKPKRGRRRRKKPSAEAQAADSRNDAVTSGAVEDTRRSTPSALDVVDLASGQDDGTPHFSSLSDRKAEAPEAASDADAAEAETATSDNAQEAAPVAETSQTDAAEDSAPDAQDAHDFAEDDSDAPAAKDAAEVDPDISTVADDDDQEDIRPVRKPRPRRYKIQEVVKVRQIMLVQVVKEERGNKGAALTTYLSLAGRYCVLMPNTARGGGISRKITNAADRKKLKDIATSLDVPQGAGLIVRTAGAKRTKSEIKRDYEYLQRQWEQIRDLTLKSVAPAPIYQEGDLIHRSIRDLYSREIDEVLVEGEAGYRHAKNFMKMIMPSHAKNVKHYNDPLPLFARFQVEGYLADMFNPVVQLKSGGYIVIGVTEALVAIDVNSGRATKEGSIEDTATKTNLEAAEEVARQLRLRDLAGLIVIDFIDMDERKNNAAVEKRLKDKLKTDRARIQVGRISGFGLMEMSRQRLRPGMLEATTQPCHACHGTGLVRSDDSLALSILRQLEEEGTRARYREVLLTAPVGIVNFIMNVKREYLAEIEARYGLSIRIEADPLLVSPDFKIEKFKTATRKVTAVTPVISMDSALMESIEEEAAAEEPEVEVEVEAEAPPQDEQPKKKRRRRRGGRGRRKTDQNGDESGDQSTSDSDAKPEGEAPQPEETQPAEAPSEAANPEADAAEQTDEKPKRKPRSRRKKKVEEPVTADAPAEDASTPVADAAAENAEPAVTEVSEAVADAPQEAAPVADEAPVEVAQDPAETPAPVEEAPQPTTHPEAPVAEDAPAPPEPQAETPEPQPEPTAEAEPEPEAQPEPEKEPELAGADEATDESDKPKRRGWWSLG